jgi:hypothetical protein
VSDPLPVLDPAFSLAYESVPRQTFHRVYWSGCDPLAASVAGNNRYDCARSLPVADQFGVLYLGYDLQTCWMETVVRQNMIRPAGFVIQIPQAKMTDRWACEISSKDALVLAHFADEPLIDLGDSSSNIMGNSYLRTQMWSALLHAHANPRVDGLRYRSRFRSDQSCIALFERAISLRGLTAQHKRSIDPATSAETQSIMRRYNVVPI